MAISNTFFIQNDRKSDETKKLQPSHVTVPTESNTLKTNYLAKSELVQNLLNGAYMNGFDLFNFLESLQPSDCLQVCLDEVASMLEQPFAGQRSVDEIGNICSHFDIFQRCLHHNTSCKDALLDITTIIIDHLCTFSEEAFGDIFPCLYAHSTIIYFTCDNQCKMGKTLSKASKETKNGVTNISDDNRNKLFQIPNLYNLCSSSACFINCIQHMAEKECSIGHSTLLHKIVATVVNHTIKMIPSQKMKSSDAYTLLVSSILPNECQRLKLPQSVVPTILMENFISNAEYRNDNSIIQQKTDSSGEKDAIQTILNSHVTNRTNSVYVQILPLNGHQMKLQCQMIDLETGQEATIADIATLMTTEAKNIFSQFGLRSVEDERILDNNAKYEDGSGLQDRKTTDAGSKSSHTFTHIMLLNLLISITAWIFAMSIDT
uniref:Chondroitin proteoglycan 4 domain-containing protein n=1 Tax=Wuchereria bancrofti TaxID=6293 RepID=A0AAF5PIB8_WUCBA